MFLGRGRHEYIACFDSGIFIAIFLFRLKIY